MHFPAISILTSLVALAASTNAFVMMQACSGTDTGSPCVNWSGTLPSACFNLATMGQDNIVSSVTLTFDVVCTFFADEGCKGNSVTVTKTFLNLADVGFDNVASSFKCTDA
ncbi:hypothetical protein C8R43DRAFT_1135896 [Mycena crocata]|nr:hypothetical protein C8R43DRAFT_1135896 [Mycena crocata]